MSRERARTQPTARTRPTPVLRSIYERFSRSACRVLLPPHPLSPFVRTALLHPRRCRDDAHLVRPAGDLGHRHRQVIRYHLAQRWAFLLGRRAKIRAAGPTAWRSAVLAIQAGRAHARDAARRCARRLVLLIRHDRSRHATEPAAPAGRAVTHCNLNQRL